MSMLAYLVLSTILQAHRVATSSTVSIRIVITVSSPFLKHPFPAGFGGVFYSLLRRRFSCIFAASSAPEALLELPGTSRAKTRVSICNIFRIMTTSFCITASAYLETETLRWLAQRKYTESLSYFRLNYSQPIAALDT